MKTVPSFIKEFSKEQLPEEREEAAAKIRSKRAKYFARKAEWAEEQEKLKATISQREQALLEQSKRLDELQEKIAQISSSLPRKLFNYLKLRKLEADIVVGQKSYEELKQLQKQAVIEEQSLSQRLTTQEVPAEFREIQQILAEFYQEQEEKWAKSGFTKEDIKRHFSEEHLASLSLSDYIFLLKRFPSELVAHVTRQGIRDHIGHMWHTIGLGEYFDEFMKIVKDNRLRSPLGVYLTKAEKEKAVAEFLELASCKNKKEALKRLEEFTMQKQQGESGTFVDKMAVHFATQEVADAYYGAEKGNEIFIVFPAVFIASQYYFSGQLTEAGGGYDNDQWVWANEERGMSLDAGIVFIRQNAQVDPETGSRYQLDQNKKPIVNDNYKTIFQRVVESPDFEEFAKRVMEVSGQTTGSLRQYWLNPRWAEKNRELLNQLKPFRKTLEEKFGVTDRRLQDAILDYQTLFKFEVQRRVKLEYEFENKFYDEQYLTERIIEKALKAAGILFIEAKNTVTSKEFWENYFAKHPNQRPSKIVYYKNHDPTEALLEWQQEHGLTKTGEKWHLGFAERQVDRESSQALAGVDRFRSIAEKVIDDCFDYFK